MVRTVLGLLSIIFAAFGAPTIVRAAVIYSVTDLGDLGVSRPGPFGGPSANAINDAGQIVGTAPVAGSPQHAFRYQAGVMTDLGTLAPGMGGSSIGTNINSLGTIVGSTSTNPFFRGFIYSGGVMTAINPPFFHLESNAFGISDNGSVAGSITRFITVGNVPNVSQTRGYVLIGAVFAELGTLGGDLSIAIDVNDAGLVVGHSDVSAGVRHAFTWTNGVFKDIGTLGGTNSFAAAVNASGDVVGGAEIAGGQRHAYIYRGGAMVDIGPTGLFSTATDINNVGTVVGNTGFSPFDRKGFVFDGFQTRFLNELVDPASGWYITGANGINNRGQIVGTAIRNPGMGPFGIFGQTRAVLLSPISTAVPEPASWAMMIVGFGMAGFGMRRRNSHVAFA